MNRWRPSSEPAWAAAFLAVILLYGFLYAPYGINETDGGFLTGLAWQVLNGKTLYADLVYVRPPLPVWLRVCTLQLLPAGWAILGERWIFYVQVALYCWLAATLLTAGRERWRQATFGFVVSAHSYPATAWHTTDGILFAVLTAWFLFRPPDRGGTFWAGLALCAALLCKQSFYPLAVPGCLAAFFLPRKWRAATSLLAGLLVGIALFFIYLYQHDLTAHFLCLTGGATSGGQAWRHGVVDFFRIQPLLAVGTVVLLGPVLLHLWRGDRPRAAYLAWLAWLALLAGSYGWAVWRNQDFTPPFAQARLLWWLGAGYGLWVCFRPDQQAKALGVRALFLSAVSWCSAVSWGYNLPILFALPGVWAAFEIGERLRTPIFTTLPAVSRYWSGALALAALLGLFRLSYEFVYRDGRRSAMKEDLGGVFPALTGIRSTPETAALYRELRTLATQYGPNFKTLPAFPQANFLTHTRPPLPLDWVVAREMNADSALVMKVLKNENPVLLVEKRYLPAIENDPELALVRTVLRTATRLDETAYFLVLRPGN